MAYYGSIIDSSKNINLLFKREYHTLSKNVEKKKMIFFSICWPAADIFLSHSHQTFVIVLHFLVPVFHRALLKIFNSFIRL